MTSRRTLLFFILIFLTFIITGSAVKSGAQQARSPEITDISVEALGENTEIQIYSNVPLSYTIYKPADPYRVVVELQDVGPGKFKDKIVVDRAGVMEIIPSKLEGLAMGTRLEITFTVPAEVQPVQKENALILAFENPEAGEIAVASDEEPEPLTDEEAEEPLKDAEVIEDIQISKSDDMVNVLISGDGKMYPEVFELDGNKLVVDIPNVSTDIEPPQAYEPPVLGIRLGAQNGKTRLVFDLAGSTKHNLTTKGNRVVLSFERPGAEVAEAVAVASSEDEGFAGSAGGGDQSRPFDSKEYVGERISLDFQDADLIHIFRLLSDVSGYNIVVNPKVKGKFSMKLTNVPWDQALDIILKNYALSKRVEDNIIRIAPTAELRQEEEELARAKEAQEKAGDLETVIYPINYAEVKDMEKAIKDAKILSKRGFVSYDERTSSLIIKDVEEKQEGHKIFIEELDRATPQVGIEARIVEVTTNFTRELGIQWGVLWKPSPQTTVGGSSLTESAGSSGNPLLVNLPAAVGIGAGGALGFGYIAAQDLRALDIQLSAMENSGNGKIISNPRIITLDNEEATIQQGKKIPYQTVSAEGTQTQFVDASLELTVTPHITPHGTIVMDIETKKNEADFSQTVGGVPTIDTNEAKSRVLINDGDTLVMGGVFKTAVAKSEAYVPVLGKIPILGWLFKTKKDVDTTSELLIFITPRIVR